MNFQDPYPITRKSLLCALLTPNISTPGVKKTRKRRTMGGNEEEQRNNRCAWLSIALANARLQWLSRFYDHYTSYFLRALKPRALLTTSIVLIPPPRQAGGINSKMASLIECLRDRSQRRRGKATKPYLLEELFSSKQFDDVARHINRTRTPRMQGLEVLPRLSPTRSSYECAVSRNLTQVPTQKTTRYEKYEKLN